MFVIEDFDVKDIESVLAIIKTTPEHFKEGTIPEIKTDLLSSSCRTIVARDNHVSGFLTYTFRSPTKAELLWLAVTVTSQGQGVGRMLMEKFISEVVEQGGEVIEIAVIASTVDFPPYEKTRRFYEKFGFKEVRIDKDFYAPGDDRGIMQKVLK